MFKKYSHMANLTSYKLLFGLKNCPFDFSKLESLIQGLQQLQLQLNNLGLQITVTT